MGWKETDEKLIRRGELIFDLKSLKNHKQELKNMLLDTSKIKKLGWKPKHNSQQTITKTVKHLIV
jgi:nucleoside-diphosphate-sugar epimerase